jgi:multisubunit Na+/H+ antiporter MnhF subunit
MTGPTMTASTLLFWGIAAALGLTAVALALALGLVWRGREPIGRLIAADFAATLGAALAALGAMITGRGVLLDLALALVAGGLALTVARTQGREQGRESGSRRGVGADRALGKETGGG